MASRAPNITTNTTQKKKPKREPVMHLSVMYNYIIKGLPCVMDNTMTACGKDDEDLLTTGFVSKATCKTCLRWAEKHTVDLD